MLKCFIWDILMSFINMTLNSFSWESLPTTKSLKDSNVWLMSRLICCSLLTAFVLKIILIEGFSKSTESKKLNQQNKQQNGNFGCFNLSEPLIFRVESRLINQTLGRSSVASSLGERLLYLPIMSHLKMTSELQLSYKQNSNKRPK